jgi:hypothetical protein
MHLGRRNGLTRRNEAKGDHRNRGQEEKEGRRAQGASEDRALAYVSLLIFHARLNTNTSAWFWLSFRWCGFCSEGNFLLGRPCVNCEN